jgi:hypothetical protein
MHYILQDGQPVKTENLREWAHWFEKCGEERIVARDEIEGITVSTVFLALDHGLNSDSPILWETMIFAVDHPDLDGEMWRYTTESWLMRVIKRLVRG